MNYSLPTSVEIAGKEYAIRSDFRAALDIFEALNDEELSDRDRADAVLVIFYPDCDAIPLDCVDEAISQCFWFLRGGEEDSGEKHPTLMSWEQDFPLICPPVNRIIGRDVRGMEYLHWWSFLSAYKEIGDCLFAQVVAIRSKKAQGKTLDKTDRDFYKRNRDIVDLKTKHTNEEKDILKEWM